MTVRPLFRVCGTRGCNVRAVPVVAVVTVLVIGAGIGGTGSVAQAADRHAGYYYPAPAMVEELPSKARRMTRADRHMRAGFAVDLADQLLSRTHAPTEYIFARGVQAERLIIVGAGPDRLDTVFRVRGYLATMTAAARATPVFSQNPQDDAYTFIDLLKVLGFQTITLSDGDSFTHQIVIK